MDSLVEPDEDFTQPPWGAFGRNLTLGVVSLGSNLVMHILNRLTIDGRDQFREQVLDREPGRALITVCNHAR